MSGNALPTDGRFRFVASDRTGRPWITLFVLRGVHVMGTGSHSPAQQAMAVVGKGAGQRGSRHEWVRRAGAVKGLAQNSPNALRAA